MKTFAVKIIYDTREQTNCQSVEQIREVDSFRALDVANRRVRLYMDVVRITAISIREE